MTTNVPFLQALDAICNLMIACAYYAIPVGLAILLRRHLDLPFRWLVWLFVVFIAACGTTHLMHVLEAFMPMPLLAVLVDLVTAMVSVLTALLLWIFLDQCEQAIRHPLLGGGHE